VQLAVARDIAGARLADNSTLPFKFSTLTYRERLNENCRAIPPGPFRLGGARDPQYCAVTAW